MPVLPSGRRIEFSLDRFLAMLDQLHPEDVAELASALHEPDDLLPVVDVVDFEGADEQPRFAGYVAADWEQHAQDWSVMDQMALRSHLSSELSQGARAEAITALKLVVVDGAAGRTEAAAKEELMAA